MSYLLQNVCNELLISNLALNVYSIDYIDTIHAYLCLHYRLFSDTFQNLYFFILIDRMQFLLQLLYLEPHQERQYQSV